MKKLLCITIVGMVLSSCATLSPKSTTAAVLQQDLSSADQTQLNTVLNTATDNVPSVWHNSEGNTTFELVTSDTHVNEQGLPCRSYTLSVDREYRRKQVTNAIACRDNGKWQISS